MALQTPGPMGQGNAKLGLYVDERANDQQREALGTILGGQAGGMPAHIPEIIPISEMLGVKFVPITFKSEGKERHLEVPGVMDVSVEGMEGAPGKIMHVENVLHPANTRLALAKGTGMNYQDYGMTWTNMGTNGHYAPL